ncbi:conserved protein of unknown function [Acidithiobacillus ferrivorans]|uniref:DUF1643 domain-containing protein n=2 Tax=Acidithiobacillus ferrivorans TaxID=160808 RepID=A0A060UPF7_9PROT|nr:DUF1643 domain-containing protein [Acidithiobacillus ferrivorans]CDQ10166.1 conserved hypothetical protein [Acidithiobacillus ferrivorans]SMH64123.1 conserved protein of unknown function [Acidithiobacillus ferrivorans]
MRIGRTVQHTSAVDTTQITALFSPCRTWRYRLTLPFSGRRGDMVAIFLKNPSSASEMAADKTVRTASEYVWRHFPQAGGLHILNLYALRGTDSKEVGGTLRQQGEVYVIGPENDAAIRETLSASPTVIIAWGGHAGIPPVPYDRRVEHCLGILDESKSAIWRNVRKGSEKYPFHACYWAYDDRLTPVQMP